MKSKLIIVGALVALILFLDQLIKIYIKNHFGPGEEYPLIGSVFKLVYIENQGMAFGTTFGAKAWHKLALSLFRVGAIIAITYYWFQQLKKNAKLEYLIALGLILAGAAGNLIDSMLYDYIFKFDPCFMYNFAEGSGIKHNCGIWGEQEIRNHGFLFANVVDMFKFEAHWPKWVPIIGGNEVFPAIWNLADFAISTGIVMIFIRQRAYFPKVKEQLSSDLDDNLKQDSENEIE